MEAIDARGISSDARSGKTVEKQDARRSRLLSMSCNLDLMVEGWTAEGEIDFGDSWLGIGRVPQQGDEEFLAWPVARRRLEIEGDLLDGMALEQKFDALMFDAS